MHKCRKSSGEFKQRRSQLNKQKISDTARKEAKEGSLYKSNIGLNLNSSETQRELNAPLSITELCAVDMTRTEQEKYENAVPKYTQRASIRKESIDDNKFYNFVFLNNETNLTISQER